MLQHDAQAGEVGEQRRQHAIEEHRFAIEDVDRRIGDLAMDA